MAGNDHVQLAVTVECRELRPRHPDHLSAARVAALAEKRHPAADVQLGRDVEDGLVRAPEGLLYLDCGLPRLHTRTCRRQPIAKPSGARFGPFLVELSRPDRLGHFPGLLSIDGAVLELDHRVEALPRELPKLAAPRGTKRPLDRPVLDAQLVQRLL